MEDGDMAVPTMTGPTKAKAEIENADNIVV